MTTVLPEKKKKEAAAGSRFLTPLRCIRNDNRAAGEKEERSGGGFEIPHSAPLRSE